MTNAPHDRPLLLIEDDSEILQLLSEFLQGEGYACEIADRGDLGLRKALETAYALVILDIMLPGMDGLSVLRALRRERDTPVILLTARGEDIDRINGLESGADDYLAKPFNPMELLARIRAILRRVDRTGKDGVIDSAHAALILGPLSIDLNRHEALINDAPLSLTATELDLLCLMTRHQGELLTRKQLTQRVLERPLSAYDRAIDMHVSNLRRKLGKASRQLQLTTVRGQGYILEAIP